MRIRKANESDMTRILEIFAHAREVMRQNGNPMQWKTSYPSREILLEDIEKQRLYVMESDQIEAVFVFFIGIEPTYLEIDGAWLSDQPYGVIHRVASSGRVKGVVGKIVAYCSEKISTIRIDTHENNAIMQHTLEKEGFQRCGVIRLENGDPRIAYQR